MNDFPKIKEHYDMSQRKNAKAIPFQWKTILCDATGYYKKSPKCFVVEVHTENPAGGKPLQRQHNTTLKGREEIADFLASEESIAVKEDLYKKYAEQQVKTFPGNTVQLSAEGAYTLLEATGEFQSYLAREIEKDRKNPANTKDTLNRDLLDKYLSFYGNRPLCRIDKGVRKTVEQDLAAQDPRFTKHQMRRCRHRLELMQWYAADHGWMNMPKRRGRKRYDAQGQKRSKLGNQSLSHEEFSRLLEQAKQNALQNGLAVGVLLVLLEGFSPEEACSLQYGNYVRLPGSAYYSLRVLRPYLEKADNVLQFGREKVYPYRLRYVPVCQPLQEILQRRAEWAREKGGRSFLKMPIVCSKTEWKTACRPEELQRYSKSLLKQAGFAAGTYKKTDEKSDHQEEKTIGATVRVLHRTFDEMVKGWLRAGEKDHLQGWAPKTVMDKVYRDYQSVWYQECIGRKLDEAIRCYQKGA